MRYAALSETGKVREHNEDNFHADGRIFIVADGMGGHRAGEVASAGAIEEFMRFERENHGMDPLERIKDGVMAANEYLYDKALHNPELEGMGTTFTLALYEGELYIAHVGDSRVYLFRDGGLARLTRDHSLVEQMVSEGYISRREARVHPQRNVILQALGVSEDLEIDLDSIDLIPSDRVLLCTDGLSGVLEDADMASLLSKPDEPGAVCSGLIEAARERGATDDMTAVLIDFDVAPDSPADRGKEKKAWWKPILAKRQA